VKKLFVLILAGLFGASVLTTTIGCDKKADDKKKDGAAAPAAKDDKGGDKKDK
jgi:hypothetical protein